MMKRTSPVVHHRYGDVIKAEKDRVQMSLNELKGRLVASEKEAEAWESLMISHDRNTAMVKATKNTDLWESGTVSFAAAPVANQDTRTTSHTILEAQGPTNGALDLQIFIVSSLAKRDDTQIISVCPLTGTLLYAHLSGVDLFESETEAINYLTKTRNLTIVRQTRGMALIGFSEGRLAVVTGSELTCTLPCGASVYTVSSARWFVAAGKLNVKEGYDRETDMLAAFPLGGLHFYSEDIALTGLYPGQPGDEPEQFRWNAELCREFEEAGLGDWCVRLLQGFAASRTMQGKDGALEHVCLIAKKSGRHPGSRYTARGLDVHNAPANEVECQVVVWRDACCGGASDRTAQAAADGITAQSERVRSKELLDFLLDDETEVVTKQSSNDVSPVAKRRFSAASSTSSSRSTGTYPAGRRGDGASSRRTTGGSRPPDDVSKASASVHALFDGNAAESVSSSSSSAHAPGGGSVINDPLGATLDAPTAGAEPRRREGSQQGSQPPGSGRRARPDEDEEGVLLVPQRSSEVLARAAEKLAESTGSSGGQSAGAAASAYPSDRGLAPVLHPLARLNETRGESAGSSGLLSGGGLNVSSKPAPEQVATGRSPAPTPPGETRGESAGNSGFQSSAGGGGGGVGLNASSKPAPEQVAPGLRPDESAGTPEKSRQATADAPAPNGGQKDHPAAVLAVEGFESGSQRSMSPVQSPTSYDTRKRASAIFSPAHVSAEDDEALAEFALPAAADSEGSDADTDNLSSTRLLGFPAAARQRASSGSSSLLSPVDTRNPASFLTAKRRSLDPSSGLSTASGDTYPVDDRAADKDRPMQKSRSKLFFRRRPKDAPLRRPSSCVANESFSAPATITPGPGMASPWASPGAWAASMTLPGAERDFTLGDAGETEMTAPQPPPPRHTIAKPAPLSTAVPQEPALPPGSTRFATLAWRRGTVPLRWGSELNGKAHIGKAAIVLAPAPEKGAMPYFTDASECFKKWTGACEGQPLVSCLSLLHTEADNTEAPLADAYRQLVGKTADAGLNVQMCAFDWHRVHKVLGPDKAPQAFWNSIRKHVRHHHFAAGYIPAGEQAAHAQITARQRGFMRVNCADSLDRTNGASFLMVLQAIPDMWKSVRNQQPSALDSPDSAASSPSGGGNPSPPDNPPDACRPAAREKSESASLLASGRLPFFSPATLSGSGSRTRLDELADAKAASVSSFADDPPHASRPSPAAAALPKGGFESLRSVSRAKGVVGEACINALVDLFLQCGDQLSELYTGTPAAYSDAIRQFSVETSKPAYSNRMLSVMRRVQNVVYDPRKADCYTTFLRSRKATPLPWVKPSVDPTPPAASDAPSASTPKPPPPLVPLVPTRSSEGKPRSYSEASASSDVMNSSVYQKTRNATGIPSGGGGGKAGRSLHSGLPSVSRGTPCSRWMRRCVSWLPSDVIRSSCQLPLDLLHDTGRQFWVVPQEKSALFSVVIALSTPAIVTGVALCLRAVGSSNFAQPAGPADITAPVALDVYLGNSLDSPETVLVNVSLPVCADLTWVAYELPYAAPAQGPPGATSSLFSPKDAGAAAPVRLVQITLRNAPAHFSSMIVGELRILGCSLPSMEMPSEFPPRPLAPPVHLPYQYELPPKNLAVYPSAFLASHSRGSAQPDANCILQGGPKGQWLLSKGESARFLVALPSPCIVSHLEFDVSTRCAVVISSGKSDDSMAPCALELQTIAPGESVAVSNKTMKMISVKLTPTDRTQSACIRRVSIHGFASPAAYPPNHGCLDVPTAPQPQENVRAKTSSVSQDQKDGSIEVKLAERCFICGVRIAPKLTGGDPSSQVKGLRVTVLDVKDGKLLAIRADTFTVPLCLENTELDFRIEVTRGLVVRFDPLSTYGSPLKTLGKCKVLQGPQQTNRRS